MRGIACLLTLLLAACSPSGDDAEPTATSCTLGGSSACSDDQPSLVTCPAGVTFDAGALVCSPIFLSSDSVPGSTALCCGTCRVAQDSGTCDGGGLVTCLVPYSFNTSSCTPLFDAAGITPASPQWCCP